MLLGWWRWGQEGATWHVAALGRVVKDGLVAYRTYTLCGTAWPALEGTTVMRETVGEGEAGVCRTCQRLVVAEKDSRVVESVLKDVNGAT